MAGFVRDPGLMEDQKAAVPSDTEDNAVFGDRFAQAIWSGHTEPANITILLEGQGGTRLLPNAIPGCWHSVPPFKRVMATGTTPTVIVVGTPFRR